MRVFVTNQNFIRDDISDYVFKLKLKLQIDF